MATVAFCSAKGSPGVTTTVLALQHIWPSVHPDRRVLVVEADPAGADIATGYLQGQRAQHGLLDLAVTRTPDPVTAVMEQVVSLDDAGQRLLLLGVADAHRATAVSGAWGTVAAALDGLGGQSPPIDVLLDLGRITTGTDVDVLQRRSDLVVLVTSSTLSAVVLSRTAVARLRDDSDTDLRCLVVGAGRPYGAGEVADAIGVPLVGEMAYDPSAAAVFSFGAGLTRRTARSALLRSARAVVGALPAPANEPDLTPGRVDAVPTHLAVPGA